MIAVGGSSGDILPPIVLQITPVMNASCPLHQHTLSPRQNLIQYISVYNHNIKHAAFDCALLTWFQLFSLFESKKLGTDCISRFLTHFDGAEPQMLPGFKETAHYLGITNPKVIFSHGLPVSYQNSELAMHINIFLHVLNGSQLAMVWMVCPIQ